MSRGHPEKKTPSRLRPEKANKTSAGANVIMAGRGFPEILVANLPTVTGCDGVARVMLPTKSLY